MLDTESLLYNSINGRYKKIWFLLSVVVAAVFSYLNFYNNKHNWDLIGYLGCYYASTEQYTDKEIHKLTYSEVKKISTSEEFVKLSGSNIGAGYRYNCYENSDSFLEQLPYYQVKILYNSLIYVIINITGEIGNSPAILNSIIGFLLGVLIFYFLSYIFPNYNFFNFILMLILLSNPMMSYCSQNVTPDLLVTLLSLLFLLVYIKKKSRYVLFFILYSLMLTRPDFVLFGLCYYLSQMLILFVAKSKIDFKSILFCVLLFLGYVFIVKWYDYPGWKDLFYDSFIHRRNTISKEVAEFTFKEYLDIVTKNLLNMKKIILISVFFLLFALRFSKNFNQKIFSIFVFSNIYIKFLIFPASGEGRFYIAFLMILLFWVLYLLANTLKKELKRRI